VHRFLYIDILFLFSLALQPSAGYGLLVHEVSWSHNEAPQSVGLLWTSDQLVSETLPDNPQHTQQTHIHAPGGIRTYDRSRRAAVDLHLRPRGHWDRLSVYTMYTHTHTKCPTGCNTSTLHWFYCKITLHVSGTFRTHHQEYNNCSWQPLVQHMLRLVVHRFVLYIYICVCVCIYIHTHTQNIQRDTTVRYTTQLRSRPIVTCDVPVAIKYSYCTSDDGYGQYPKHVEWFCSKCEWVYTSIYIYIRFYL
jgi:hypothetical protein